ncbi:MAG: helix-turn-helix domain-containing protein [Lactobacillaceae bacterium]|nr:helix-turn-helix domain-containing protein [Lactobacillaceae bacterium]
MTTTKPTYGTVLIKADAILDALATTHGQTLTDIAAATGFTRSTTLKILDTLLQLQYVEKNEHDKKYQIGSAFLKYSDAYLNTFSIVNLCHPDLLKLRDEFGETVHLGTMENDDLIYLDKFPRQEINHRNDFQNRCPCPALRNWYGQSNSQHFR